LRIVADLQIHSRFSGATSSKMILSEVAYYASLKGLGLVGTGDSLHPLHFRELKAQLEELDGTGLYRLKGGPTDILFIVQTEVATVHEYGGRTKRIHHVILFRDLETSAAAAEALSRYGDIASDGRPVLNIHPEDLVDKVLGIDEESFLFPAHAWTPWWSIFGAISGVDSVEECYGSNADKIYAIETGLSSDPPMNWRISSLDRFILLSSSDSHSPYPYRLGREAVVLDLEAPSYSELIQALRHRDRNRVKLTLEVPPSYGKYHWSGHRKCGVGPIPPEKAIKMGYRCPKCGRTLTKGVEDRVEELADRPRGYRPSNAIDFMYILPLQELIAISMNLESSSDTILQSRRVWREYIRLVERFGSEYNLLVDAAIEDVAKASSQELANLVEDMRAGQLKIVPGYDGVYGRILFKGAKQGEPAKEGVNGTLEDYL